MLCEHCSKPHIGLYGSGRFCSSVCARGFSTTAKRAEINTAVSLKLSGRPGNAHGFKHGYDPRRHIFTPTQRRVANSTFRTKKLSIWDKQKEAIVKDVPTSKRYLRRFLLETIARCEECSRSKWRGKPLMLEVHHKDGNKRHNRRSNIQLLCPNCHSQTDNFRNSKRPNDGTADMLASKSSA